MYTSKSKLFNSGKYIEKKKTENQNKKKRKEKKRKNLLINRLRLSTE